jgi:RNA polymerase sigma-70 factor, ECF subfamily
MDELQRLIACEIPHLRRYALALLRDSDAVDDLVQDCLERALRKCQLWQQQGSIRSWLFRMLYHIFLNSKKTRQRESRAVPLEAIESTMAESARQEQYIECRDIAAALAQLPAQQYAAIMMIALEGMSYEEAAWLLGIPVGTLRSRLFRGRETLRTLRGDGLAPTKVCPATHGHKEASSDTSPPGSVLFWHYSGASGL